MKSISSNLFIRLIIRALSFLVIIIFGFTNIIVAQDVVTLKGKVVNEINEPLPNANIQVLETNFGTVTDIEGVFVFKINTTSKRVNIVFSYIGYNSDTVSIAVKNGLEKTIKIQLFPVSTELGIVSVEDKHKRQAGLSIINPKTITKLPSASSSIESMIKTMPGVVSNNELSNQYSVRGGSYDENMIYVNDIEIYRPFLISSSNQEGLSFLNSSLVSSISFSAGGFEAKYGDKMSSVLDIKYRKPTSFAASADVSLLGVNAHFENISKNKKLSYIFGTRYKTNAYLLGGLDTKAEYKPAFFDIQTLINYSISPKLEISFLGYYSNNKYHMIPKSRMTKFGTSDTAYGLIVFYEGQELDRYRSALGGLTLTYNVNKNFWSKLIVSAYDSKENESYDILGEYLLGIIDNVNTTKKDSINVLISKGVGGQLSHARNKLNVFVTAVENRYTWIYKDFLSQWGIKFQNEQINDKIHEWQLIDSAGYSLPNVFGIPGDEGNKTDLILDYLYSTSNNLNNNRLSAFAQSTWTKKTDDITFSTTFGLRSQYWSFNKQLVVSPRVTFSVKPDSWARDILFRASVGMYHQPPFYKEITNFEGKINKDIKSQQAIHFVVGSDWNFYAWERPFKFSSDVYYKSLKNLIPYEIENIRIKYMGENASKGFAYGLDMKVNGEFVRGIESWASLSIMKTKEDLLNDFYYKYYDSEGNEIYKINDKSQIADSAIVYPGYIPRSGDQRVTFSIFFQDYLPKNPTYKINIGFYFGTGLPTGAPKTPFYTHIFRLPPYKRLDIGLTKQIIGSESKRFKTGFGKNFESLWIALEVLNIWDIKNTVSYTWVKDTGRRQYAVPNYLTPRQVNFRIGATF